MFSLKVNLSKGCLDHSRPFPFSGQNTTQAIESKILFDFGILSGIRNSTISAPCSFRLFNVKQNCSKISPCAWLAHVKSTPILTPLSDFGAHETSSPEQAEYSRWQSAVVAPIGPMTELEPFTLVPSLGMRPQVVLRPTISQEAAGTRIEPPPSIRHSKVNLIDQTKKYLSLYQLEQVHKQQQPLYKRIFILCFFTFQYKNNSV